MSIWFSIRPVCFGFIYDLHWQVSVSRLSALLKSPLVYFFFKRTRYRGLRWIWYMTLCGENNYNLIHLLHVTYLYTNTVAYTLNINRFSKKIRPYKYGKFILKMCFSWCSTCGKYFLVLNFYYLTKCLIMVIEIKSENNWTRLYLHSSCCLNHRLPIVYSSKSTWLRFNAHRDLISGNFSINK